MTKLMHYMEYMIIVKVICTLLICTTVQMDITYAIATALYFIVTVTIDHVKQLNNEKKELA